MKNRQRLQALFDALVQAGEVVTLANGDGTYTVIPKEQVWAALMAAAHGEIKDPIVKQLLAASGSDSRVCGLVRMLAKSIQQAQAEGFTLAEPVHNRANMDDFGIP